MLLTTHYLEEAQELADRVAVLRSGRLVALGTPDELRAAVPLAGTISFRMPPGFTAGDLPDLAGRPHVDGRLVRMSDAHARWRTPGA